VTLAHALLVALPALYWDQPASTAEALRAAGIERIRVAPERAAEWRDALVEAVPLERAERSARIALRPPGIAARAFLASASRRPWLDANGWRYLRRPGERNFLTAPPGKAVLAAAEAFAHGADLVLAIDPADLEACGRALALFRSLPEGPTGAVADLAVVDDGSFQSGELMNLLARRNLLFRPVARAAPDLPLTVALGSKRYPKAEAGNPDALALKVRADLGDQRRSLRVYGSEVVLARLEGDATRLRLHLLNYGGREVEGLRVRLRGAWSAADALVLGHGRVATEDRLDEDEATEFSLPVLGPYAVVDLNKTR
jgi:hypothetical protein